MRRQIYLVSAAAAALALWTHTGVQATENIFTDVTTAAGIHWKHSSGESKDYFLIEATGSGVALDSPDGLSPDLRSSKIEGQANYVNPGLFLYNAGIDADLTPRLRAFLNLNVIRFADTGSLELVLDQVPIHAGVGADSGIGATWRPKLSENISFTSGFNAFFPFQGFRDIYTGHTLLAVFTSVKFRF